MGKIIKEQIEQIKIKGDKFDLGMKGQFRIEFANDTFGPYDYKFGREDCYYQDGFQDRGSVLFPYKNKEFNNTEIFLETDDIVVCTGERTNLKGDEKAFIDVINIKTEKKQRLFIEEVNLIYNGENEIIINANFDGVWKTVKLVEDSMEIKEEKEEKLLAFFKVVYNASEEKWYRLDWNGINYDKKNAYFLENRPKYYNQIISKDNNIKAFNSFDRLKFLLKYTFHIKLMIEKLII